MKWQYKVSFVRFLKYYKLVKDWRRKIRSTRGFVPTPLNRRRKGRPSRVTLQCHSGKNLKYLKFIIYFQINQAADIDVRPELYKHIVLSGGSTMYPGLPSRVEREVRQLYFQRVVKVSLTCMSLILGQDYLNVNVEHIDEK